MKCPKCHREVEKGFLYCPHCLAEIPWVKEFDSVETLLKKEEQRNPQKSQHAAVRKRNNGSKRRRWKRKLKKKLKEKMLLSKKKILLLVLLFFVFLGFVFYREFHTFSHLYSYAGKQYELENYEIAARFADEALDQKPDSEAATILMARIMEAQGDTRSAILMLRPMIKNQTAGISVYQELVKLLEQEGKLNEIRQLLKGSSQEIRDACSEYVCDPPVTSLPPGTYTSVQTVELKADYDTIYYTLDGSVPDQNSQKYKDPVILPEGTTELRAFGVNAKGIESELITRKYVIVLKTPDAPKVSPKSGDYDKKTKIKITVPDGCKAYYAFDSEPDINSTQYEQPISMPQGYHRFYAILVAANGKISKVTMKEYYLQY